jgi:hypothetical protein
MDPIRDLTWMQHLLYGTTIEKFGWRGLRVVSLSVPATDKRHLTQYAFRMLFFERGSNRPCLAVNCEHTILESYCLTEQVAEEHTVFMRLDGPPTYEGFKGFALQKAAGRRKQPRERRPVPGAVKPLR